MIEVIPAIDVIGGKCVRLTKGDYSQKTEYGDPVEMAKRFQDYGLRRLHLVDLDGARSGRVINYNIIEKIAAKTSLIIDVGGGIKTDEDLHIVFESGAVMVTGGSIAVKHPDIFEQWLKTYGNEKIILGSDFKDGRIAVSGWEEETSEELITFLKKWTVRGVSKTICTDVQKDGLLEGTSEEVYKEIRKAFPELYLVASGGVSSIDDIVSLESAGIPAVIIGKSIYEGNISLKDLEQFIV
ncbi:MAG TPA: 1-(5-phosphoribosyl)-5-[(5-phosphoribosylamino)methylideneamino]imidazole-4-carboxamide isomerase [Bacteroidales bacterium]|nr:1-(5-phosphoribosyl)-5-[(5-phosphoribosylamino)methylideneamino]imidazole-4-carboxamide isomerase [Bacteroidales bacterium]